MSNRFKLIGLLTPAQSEVLKTLYELCLQVGPDRFWRPKDLGAYRSSHHALTLKKLEERGLVERVELSSAENVRASFKYRITRAGLEAWQLLLDASSVPPHAMLGGMATQSRVQLLARMAA